MPKLPRVSSVEAIRALENLGFVQVRQRGSHLILKKQLPVDDKANPQGVVEVGCVVPVQRKTLAVGTLKSILEQAGVSVEDFLMNL
ncbi:type II toxin-antitoxin system HicA family toxin [Planktothrix sp. FACHB-1355]|uniref:Type II toxin-antitoxin system HicA family toxin n=1 Tax=Aerosakkonema funiforme FACHB-1375 TaxID=2949571 RepID=A0A926ZL68_9CYAN|nr:type II toxin-antitoxin system HicA family toxin [Aerosakkonema funiforme]MBD2186414.1 type II toxin-antitoxin system HicA family toxin [Aerosakkonema funiforme FACHB-1375]MBD3561410.1 type II toxin-antitoxin system HicA family toxin [Planktothrix sp. FACHB-1355]